MENELGGPGSVALNLIFHQDVPVSQKEGLSGLQHREDGRWVVCSPEVAGQPPPITDGVTEAERGNLLPFLCSKLLAELELAALSSNSRFYVFIYQVPLPSPKRQARLHLWKRAQPVQRISGGKGQACLKTVYYMMRQNCRRYTWRR